MERKSSRDCTVVCERLPLACFCHHTTYTSYARGEERERAFPPPKRRQRSTYQLTVSTVEHAQEQAQPAASKVLHKRVVSKDPKTIRSLATAVLQEVKFICTLRGDYYLVLLTID